MVIEVSVFSSRAVTSEPFKDKESLLLTRVNLDHRIRLVAANACRSFRFLFKNWKIMVRISIFNLSKLIYMFYTKRENKIYSVDL